MRKSPIPPLSASGYDLAVLPESAEKAAMGETRASAQALTPTLTPLAEAIWLGEGAIVDFYGFPYPTRCLVVRLADGGLWVWSPVELTADLRAEVEALGPVAHLVSPNKPASPK